MKPLAADASPAEQKALYRKLALKLHPDKAGGDAVEFQNLNNAYENLATKHPSSYEGPSQTPQEAADAAEAAKAQAAAEANA